MKFIEYNHDIFNEFILKGPDNLGNIIIIDKNRTYKYIKDETDNTNKD